MDGVIHLKVGPNTAHEAHSADLDAHVLSRDPAKTAFIVRAVNHHEALVDIARAMAAEMTSDSTGDMIRYGQAVDRARALLFEIDIDNTP